VTLAASPWPDAILQRPVPARLHVVGSTEMIPLPVERWHDHHLGEEEFLREWVCDPVLDVGCGPGRHSAALARTGRDVLGIDVSQAAVQSARRRGADALRISVFGSVPRAGQWMTVLLLDGNIGIGGDPDRLLSRVGDLLADRGSAVVELEPPGRETRQYQARVHHRGSFSPGFPWASVGAGAIRSIAAGAGFETRRVWREGSRWFGHLSKA
jgi:SAM-dependent methyltransferase